MVSFPNAKINIGLNIVGKRPDGFHNIETIFYPVQLKDALEIIPAEKYAFTSSGLAISGAVDNNLCSKAWHLLKSDFKSLPAVHTHLHKVIPMGAGLGGGSADAAFMLILLNKYFELRLNTEQLLGYAASLGSDCAFFIYNHPCYAEGRGELLSHIPVDLSRYKILIVHPGIHINTAEAFKQIQPRPADGQLREKIALPPSAWKDHIRNDFEAPVFAAHPEIAAIKDNMYATGASYASMSGSGSSVFGIFSKTSDPTTDFPAHYFYRWV